MDKNVKAYNIAPPFNPPKNYKEIQKFDFKLKRNNKIYEMVRNLLILLNMDKEHINTSKWNPFSEIVNKGDIVLIKPNFVKHFHPFGKKGVISQITHASILRPIIDYTLLALKGDGRIIIADTPLDKADFNKVTSLNKTVDLIKFYKKQLNENIELYDLRSYCLKRTRKRYDKKRRIKLSGPPGGYVKIDLKNRSELCEFDDEKLDYYTLADSTIEKYDIRTRKKGKTNEFHSKNKHVYKIPKLVLESDVVISVPKLKTHRMAGVTLNLKNMIGICEKIYLPHHRRGSPPIGDAFPKDPTSTEIIRRKLIHKYTISLGQISTIIERIKSTKLIAKYFYPYYERILNKMIIKEDWWGAWWGNDTLWRTIYDLNKILLYSDKYGTIMDKPQRNYFNVIDGIIGQEGEGPMTGTPKACGTIIGGYDPVASDSVASYIMGYDVRKLKILNNAKNLKNYKLGTCDIRNIKVQSNIENPLKINLKFAFPKGYKNLVR